MKNSEIRALNDAEIKQKIASEEETLKKLRFAHAVSPIENPMKIKGTKKLIARLKTALRAKELDK
ncbi:MAG: 50S ribosomal protein L29 [Cyclobacteriaceae bacterium]|nr:50S ribosomal protein L29 [Cyclobacteriaceae bacterium]